MSITPKKTMLFDEHKKLNGNIIDFYGVYLPVLYTSIQEEHFAVRTNMGIFDVSHMGNIILNFKDRDTAIKNLNYLFTNDISKIRSGKIIYSTMCNFDGGVIDDLFIMCISDTQYHLVVNSSNIEKDFEWIKKNILDIDTTIENQSDNLSIIAIQGPNTIEFLDKEFNFSLSQIKSFEFVNKEYKNFNILISRTGYTGEDGVEIIIPNEIVIDFFNNIIEKGKKYNMMACGLGARDTLRLEAGLPLYGQEFDENHSPLQSMMRWSVKINKESDFIGKKAILEGKDTKFSDIMIGFEVCGKSIPRTGMEILNSNQEKIGYVTSGTYAPYIKKNIGIAYILKDYCNSNDLYIKIRNKIEQINILPLPFYKRKK